MSLKHRTGWCTPLKLAASMLIGLSACTAWAAVEQADPVTGQVWSLFDSPTDGLAQGYRAASVDEFRALLSHAQWLPRNGSTTVFDFTTGGLSKDASNRELWNLPNLVFGPGRAAAEQLDLAGVYTSTAGWLANADGSSSLGLIESQMFGGQACSGGRTFVVCTYFSNYSNAAEIASLSDLDTKFAVGQFPSYFPSDDLNHVNPVSGYRNQSGGITAGTFMISTVPEGSRTALMAWGLVAVAGAATLRKRSAP